MADRESLLRAEPWRVGSHYSIHVYCDDVPVATFLTAMDAKLAVEAVNAWLAHAERAEKQDGRLATLIEEAGWVLDCYKHMRANPDAVIALEAALAAYNGSKR